MSYSASSSSSSSSSSSAQPSKRLRITKSSNTSRCPCGKRFDTLTELQEHMVVHAASTSSSTQAVLDHSELQADDVHAYEADLPMEVDGMQMLILQNL
jgi:hypothetical protein